MLYYYTHIVFTFVYKKSFFFVTKIYLIIDKAESVWVDFMSAESRLYEWFNYYRSAQ